MKCLTCHGLITNGNCGCSTGTQGAASVNIDTMLRDRDAEIARLKAEVERLREYERLHGTRSNEIGRLRAETARLRAEVGTLTSELTDADQVTRDALGHARAAWEGERKRLEVDLAAHKRALAAGPAALHYRSCDCCSIVERAQAEAMKEGT